MKVKIQTYKIVKELVSDKEFEMPEEPTYFFQPTIRRSVRFIPIYSTYNTEKGKPEVILRYHITVIYLSGKNKVESFFLSATAGLSELYNMKEERFTSETSSVVKALFNGFFEPRTKEQFEGDLRTVINTINKFE